MRAVADSGARDRMAAVVGIALEHRAADDRVLGAVLEAVRALLYTNSRAEERAVLAGLVERLGGRVVPADSGVDVIPLDLSLADGAPLLPAAPPGSPARLVLERFLPQVVDDARRIADLRDRYAQLAEDAAVDVLTGVANRRSIGRVLGRAERGDAVVILDLDHFKALNDTLGHDEGDRVLRAFGRLLRERVRAADRPGRWGGEEFVVVLPRTTLDEAEQVLSRLRHDWRRCRPRPVTFSAGIAAVRRRPLDALSAADRALYRAKAAGRDRWVTATEEDR